MGDFLVEPFGTEKSIWFIVAVAEVDVACFEEDPVGRGRGAWVN